MIVISRYRQQFVTLQVFSVKSNYRKYHQNMGHIKSASYNLGIVYLFMPHENLRCQFFCPYDQYVLNFPRFMTSHVLSMLTF